MMNIRIIVCVLALGAGADAQGQQLSCQSAVSAGTKRISALLASRATDITDQIANFFDRAHITACVADAAPQSAAVAQMRNTQVVVAKQIESKRTDVSAGAPPSATGTTTAVASASKPNFLGLALENGAVTQKTQGTSSTVSINPWKFVTSIANDEKIPINPADPGSRLLQKLALSISLNTGGTQSSTTTSTSSPTPATLFTQLKEVSDLTVHFDIHNDRDPMSAGAARRIRKGIEANFPPLFFGQVREIVGETSDDIAAFATPFTTYPTLSDADIQAKVQAFLTAEGSKLADNPVLLKAVNGANANAATILSLDKATYDAIAHSWTLGMEYSLDRQPMIQAAAGTTATATTATPLVNPPDLHTVRLIHSNRFIGSSEYTLTASASFFGSKTATMPDAWRDFRAGAKIDIPFAGIANVVDKGTLTFSGLFVDLHQMPLGVDLQVNGVSVTQPGRIGLFQAKYSIPVGNGTGTQVPISITYSNRSDLVKETEVRGSIGITWDMSKLIANKQAGAAQ